MNVKDLLKGIVVQTDKESWIGKYIYSDFYYEGKNWYEGESDIYQDCTLNQMARAPILGIAAGVIRCALSVIHTLGHLFVALIKSEKGHLYHAAKGGCEFLRGIIEALPIIGRIFANTFSKTPSLFNLDNSGYISYSWWIIKIYNPNQKDLLDQMAGDWHHFREKRPEAFIIV